MLSVFQKKFFWFLLLQLFLLPGCTKVVPEIISLLSSKTQNGLVWVKESTSGQTIATNSTFGFSKNQFILSADWAQVENVKYRFEPVGGGSSCETTPPGGAAVATSDAALDASPYGAVQVHLCLWTTTKSTSTTTWVDEPSEWVWRIAEKLSVLQVYASSANQKYGVGQLVQINVEFSGPVQVSGGSIYLDLDVSGNAQYSTLSYDTLTFNYFVQAGDNTADLNALSLNASVGQIKDIYGEDVWLTMPSAGNTLIDQNDIVIDTTPPSVPTLTYQTPSSSPSANSSPTFLASGLVAGDYLHLFKDSCSGSPFMTWTASASSNSLPLSALSDGSYQFFLKAVDDVGNASACSSALSYVVDTRAPIASLSSGSIPALAYTSFSDSVVNSRAGPALNSYRFAVIPSGDSCVSAAYSTEQYTPLNFTPPAPDGQYKLCLLGTNIYGVMQPSGAPTEYLFVVNTVPPSFTVAASTQWVGPNGGSSIELDIIGAQSVTLNAGHLSFSGSGSPCSFTLNSISASKFQITVSSCSNTGDVYLNISTDVARNIAGVPNTALTSMNILKSDGTAPGVVDPTFTTGHLFNAGLFFTNNTSGVGLNVGVPAFSGAEISEHKISGPHYDLTACNTSDVWSAHNSSADFGLMLPSVNTVNSIYFKFKDGLDNIGSCFVKYITHDNIIPTVSGFTWTAGSIHSNRLQTPTFSATYNDANPMYGFAAAVGTSSGLSDIFTYPFVVTSSMSSSGLSGASFLNGLNYYLSLKAKDSAGNYSGTQSFSWSQYCSGTPETCAQSYIKHADFLANSKAGTSVAIDGDFMAVGAPFYASGNGAVIIFKMSKHGWVYYTKLDNPDASKSRHFGKRVEFKGMKLLVGAPFALSASSRASVYGFNFNGTNFNQVFRAYSTASTAYDDGFGEAIGYSPTSDKVIVGAPAHTGGINRSGALYAFDFAITSGDVDVGAPFKVGALANGSLGHDLALSKNGQNLVVLSGYLSNVSFKFQVFSSADAFTNPLYEKTESFLADGKVAISDDGELAVYSIPANNILKLYRKAGNLLTTMSAPSSIGDQLGSALAIRRDGSNDHIFVGARGGNSGDGVVFVYSTWSGGSFASPVQTLPAPLGGGEAFGGAIAIGTLGALSEKVIAIGAPQQSGAIGPIQNTEAPSLILDSIGSANSGAVYIRTLQPQAP